MLYMYINEYLELVAVICLYQELFFFFLAVKSLKKNPHPKQNKKTLLDTLAKPLSTSQINQPGNKAMPCAFHSRTCRMRFQNLH